MTPTVHFDMAKAEDAVVHFTKVADYCGNFGTRGVHAAGQLKREIDDAKKDALSPIYADIKDLMLKNASSWEGLLGAMASFTAPSKEAANVSNKLVKALGELKKKPSDKKSMESFSAGIKDAAASCAKLRTLVEGFRQKMPKNYSGDENVKAFVIIVDTLLKYIELCMPRLAPPRPQQGPPGKR